MGFGPSPSLVPPRAWRGRGGPWRAVDGVEPPRATLSLRGTKRPADWRAVAGRGPSPLQGGLKLPVPFGEGGKGLLLRGKGLAEARVVALGEALLGEVAEDEAHRRCVLVRADEDGKATLELVVAFAVVFHGLNRDEVDGGGEEVAEVFHMRYDRYERLGLKVLPEQGLL